MKIFTKKSLVFSLSLLISSMALLADFDAKNESGKTLTVFNPTEAKWVELKNNEKTNIKVKGDWSVLIWEDGNNIYSSGLIFAPKGAYIYKNNDYLTWIWLPLACPTEQPDKTLKYSLTLPTEVKGLIWTKMVEKSNIKDKTLLASIIYEELIKKSEEYNKKFKSAKIEDIATGIAKAFKEEAKIYDAKGIEHALK